MSDYSTLLPLIPGLPLLAAIVVAALGKKVLKEKSHWPVVIALAGSFLCSVTLLFKVNADAHHAAEKSHGEHKSVGFEKTVNLWTWANVSEAFKPTGDTPYGQLPAPASIAPESSDFRVDITLRADPLTAIMLSMVTFISTLVVIYASGYMHGDSGYWRFFAYVGLFVFSMTMLVSVSNFVLLYVFWEAVGMCSYLLIGFWFEKPEAAAAGKKAFLVNRIGDFGFALGAFLIWATYGTLNFHDTNVGGTTVMGVLGQLRLSQGLYVEGGVAFAICLCLLTGSCGKSAQFPLHVWLPDAMEGPTPVSALIHAATMVTAGVYMVARCTPLFIHSPDAQAVVACIGAFTALLAGLIALTQNDLKRVLAYSTVSQLGYMFLGLGAGTLVGVTAGMFHLFTHAFFKALLFLGAGSVMHAMGNVIDMRRFGGLRKIMPWTHATFWFGCLALAGVVPFAGFWSKDAILAAIHDEAHDSTLYTFLYYSALFTAFLTAFYTFRALFMTFFGEERVPHEAGHHAHESPKAMTVPLMILAVCSLVVGAYFELTHGFAHSLHQTPSLAYKPVAETLKEGAPTFHLDVAATSTIIALAGIGLAAFLYLGHRREVDYLGRVSEGLANLRGPGKALVATPVQIGYRLSYGKFFLDQIYYVLFVLPLRLLAVIAYQIDRFLVDGIVNLVGWIPRVGGAGLRSLQSGLVQFYALAMVLGALVLVGTLLWWPAS